MPGRRALVRKFFNWPLDPTDLFFTAVICVVMCGSSAFSGARMPGMPFSNEGALETLQFDLKLIRCKIRLLVDVDIALNPRARLVGNLVIAKLNKHSTIAKNTLFLCTTLFDSHFNEFTKS